MARKGLRHFFVSSKVIRRKKQTSPNSEKGIYVGQSKTLLTLGTLFPKVLSPVIELFSSGGMGLCLDVSV